MSGPILVTGADRSGTTLLYALMASHPDISMVRRTNMFRWFHGGFGDLADPSNLERCLDTMLRYRRLDQLSPDRERIREEFREGEQTYGRLFALFHEHQAERVGKRRWADKSLHTEHQADLVFAELPGAAMVHIVRDPRDRYASVVRRYDGEPKGIGAATARWIRSTKAGHRNTRRYGDRYLMVRYEDLARNPEQTLQVVCQHVGISYDPVMLGMRGAPEEADSGGNSSFGDIQPGTISTRAIGRFRSALSPRDIAFIQASAGRLMSAAGYEKEPVHLSPGERAAFLALDLPVRYARLGGWLTMQRLQDQRGLTAPPQRLSADVVR